MTILSFKFVVQKDDTFVYRKLPRLFQKESLKIISIPVPHPDTGLKSVYLMRVINLELDLVYTFIFY